MGSTITLPVQADQDGIHHDGVPGKVIRTEKFKDHDFIPEDYDKLWEQLLRYVKAPPLKEAEGVFKEVVVSGDDAVVEVKLLCDAARMKANRGQESPTGADYIVGHFKHYFDKEARTVRSERFGDHWADVEPAPECTKFCLKVGDPLDLEYYIVLPDGMRAANEDLKNAVVMHILTIIKAELEPGRAPDVKLKWDKDKLCHYTGPLDNLASRDALFDGLLAAVRKSLATPGLPDVLEEIQETEDKYVVRVKDGGATLWENTCDSNKDAGYVSFQSSLLVRPNVRFEVTTSPLTIRTLAKQKDGTGVPTESIYAERAAQFNIDAAIKACESWF